jgi:hypothetical protein
VTIPVSTTFDGKGFDQLTKAAQRAEREAIASTRRQEREAIASTRRQIAEHRKVTQLTAKLNKELAGGGGPSFAMRAGAAAGVSLAAVDIARDAATATLSYAAAALEAGAATERLGRATDNLGAQYGVTGDAIVESIQKASLNTISEMDAMKAANQAMLLGVANNEKEFDELAQMAVVLGRAMGQDANKSIEDLTIGIGRQSKLILDNLGIMINTEKAYSDYAASVGKTVKQLSDAEKKQAFLNATLEQGRIKVDQLGGISLDSAGKVERLNARMDDLKAAVGGAMLAISDGSGVLDTLDPILEKVTGGLKGFADNSKAIEKLRDDAYKGRDGLKAVEDAADTTMAVINPLGLAIEKLTSFFGNSIFNAKALAEAKEDLAVAAGNAGDAAEEQADSEDEAAEAMDRAARAAEELARRLQAANTARRNVAGELIDINAKAAEDTASTWDDFFKDEDANWKDHGEAVDKINADSAKEQAKIQKDLAKTLFNIDKDLSKDLAKIDKDLAKDKAKLERDTDRQIGRMKQDAARSEKQERRARQIEAKGDQRLFDFEMRQLAAEGEFNQILASKERRAIEQQIAKEQDANEQKTKDENQRVEIDRVRQDAADRKAEMEAEAEEAKQLRQEQAEEARAEAREAAAEAEVLRQEELAQALADEQANYEERRAALVEARDAKLAEIEETKKQSIEKLAEELTESKDLTKEEMEALIPVAAELGVEVGAAFAEGLNSGFARNHRIGEMLGDINAPSSRPGSQNRAGAGATPSRPSRSGGGKAAGFGSNPGTLGFANGVDQFIVPPGFPNDSFQIGLTSGERVSVTPAGGASVVVNVNGIGGKELAAIMEKHAQRAVDEFYNSVVVPWSQGA